MSIFKYGLLYGSGPNTEFQLWNDKDNYSQGIETKSIDAVIGPHLNTNFRFAPFTCHQSVDKSGFTICGFDKDEIEKLANMFIDFLHEANPEFLKVPPIIRER